jgi:hypothetical protein
MATTAQLAVNRAAELAEHEEAVMELQRNALVAARNEIYYTRKRQLDKLAKDQQAVADERTH